MMLHWIDGFEFFFSKMIKHEPLYPKRCKMSILSDLVEFSKLS